MIRDKISKPNLLSSHVYVNLPFFHLNDENFTLAVFEQLNGWVNYIMMMSIDCLV